MNAPWASLSSTQREPFAAFLCEEATLETVRSVVEELGLQPERCQTGGLRQAVQSLAVTSSPAILLIDLSESSDPLTDTAALAEVCEPGTLVLAIGRVNDVRLYRDLLSSGIQDYLLKPLAAGQLREALTSAQAVFTAPPLPEAATIKRHLAAAVIGVRGGVGGSTIASSLAWLFSTEHALSTALLDLDIHFGTDALALDLEPGHGLADAIDNPDRVDGLFLERAMVRANERLSVLAAETPLHVPLVTDGLAFARLEEEFRQGFEASVVDLPRNVLINFPNLIATSSHLVLVTELTLACARDLIRLLPLLKSHSAGAETVIVANKVQAGTGEIGRIDFEASIESKIAFEVPFDGKGAAAAAKLGKAFAEANLKTKPGQALRELASALVGSEVGPRAVGTGLQRKALFRRFGELRRPKPARRKS